MEANDKFIFTSEVAKKMGCCERKVTEYRRAGVINGIRFGKRWLYSEKAIDELIASNVGRDFTRHNDSVHFSSKQSQPSNYSFLYRLAEAKK